MNNLLPFTVIQSNPNQKGGFVTKLQRKITVDHPIFGTKQKSETYYISSSKQVAVDTKVAYDSIFPAMHVVEHPMVNPDSGEIFTGKWLSLS